MLIRRCILIDWAIQQGKALYMLECGILAGMWRCKDAEEEKNTEKKYR